MSEMEDDIGLKSPSPPSTKPNPSPYSYEMRSWSENCSKISNSSFALFVVVDVVVVVVVVVVLLAEQPVFLGLNTGCLPFPSKPLAQMHS
jgi:hypothetical protein